MKCQGVERIMHPLLPFEASPLNNSAALLDGTLTILKISTF